MLKELEMMIADKTEIPREILAELQVKRETVTPFWSALRVFIKVIPLHIIPGRAVWLSSTDQGRTSRVLPSGDLGQETKCSSV